MRTFLVFLLFCFCGVITTSTGDNNSSSESLNISLTADKYAADDAVIASLSNVKLSAKDADALAQLELGNKADVTEKESQRIGQLLDIIEARLINQANKNWLEGIYLNQQTVAAVSEEQSRAQIDSAKGKEAISTTEEMIKNDKRLLGLSETEIASLKLRMMHELNLINQIRSFLISIDVLQAFCWVYGAPNNSTIQDWVTYPNVNIAYSDVQGMVFPLGDGRFQVQQPGVWLVTHKYINFVSTTDDVDKSDSYSMIQNSGAIKGIYTSGMDSNYTTVSHSEYLYAKENDVILVRQLLSARNSKVTNTLWKGSSDFDTSTQLRFITTNSDSDNNVGKKIFIFSCNNRLREGDWSKWQTYCASRVDLLPTKPGDTLQWTDAGIMTVVQAGLFRIKCNITSTVSSANWWISRGIRLIYCPEGKNCRVISSSLKTAQYFTTMFVDFSYPMLATDTFYVEAKHFSTEKNTTLWTLTQGVYDKLSVEFTGPVSGKYAQKYWIGGCARDSSKKFGPIGTITHVGQYSEMGKWSAAWDSQLDDGNWNPVCNNVAAANTFGEDLIVHGEGHFCVQKSGYYRIQAQVAYNSPSDSPTSPSRWVHSYLFLFIQSSFVLKVKSDYDNPGVLAESFYQQFRKGSVESYIDTTFPLHIGQCFYFVRYHYCNYCSCPTNSRCTSRGERMYANQVDAVDVSKTSAPSETSGSSFITITKLGEGGGGYPSTTN